MMEAEKRHNIAYWIFLSGVLLMAVGLSVSKFLMSFSQFVIAAGWFYGGDYKNKAKAFFSSKPALFISAIFLIHLLGLIYTSDFVYGMEDIRKKVPLFVIAILLCTSPKLSLKHFRLVLLLFVATVITSTLISICVLLGIIHKPIHDIREISIFISHIRLSLLICLSVFICIWFIRETKTLSHKIISIVSIIWLIIFLVIIESITGLFILLVLASIAYVYYAIKRPKFITRIIHLAVISLINIPILLYVKNQVDAFNRINNEYTSLEKFTVNGNEYSNDFNNPEKENGNYVWRYVCEKEVISEWPERCGTPFTGVDGKNNPMKSTIYRYLTSKGLRKDSAGIHSLSGEDIIFIEQGITNYKYTEMSNLNARIYQIIWEVDNYVNNHNPSGNSVTQRLEFWKAAIGIIKKNPLFGVGTGDPKNAFDQQYEVTHSSLAPEWRLRSHNQFLAVTVALGITGLLCFLFFIFYPFIISVRQKNYLYIAFFIIAFLSMLTEDTLETQAGVSFYVFFHCLFLFHKPEKK